MKVGLSALVTPGEWSFAELVRQAKATGYEAIEVVPRQGSELTLDTPEEALAGLARVAADGGIEITSLCGSGGKPSNLMTSSEAERHAGIETTKAMLRTAKALGADTILHTVGGRPGPDLYYHVAYANALRSLTQGRASFSMEPSFYTEVPNSVAEKIRGAREYIGSKK